jgi:drug/metabolite transporter (DMT)-like permease
VALPLVAALALAIDGPRALWDSFFPRDPARMAAVAASSFTGLGIHLASAALIKAVSPVTMSVVGVSKACIQSVAGPLLIFGESVRPGSWLALVVSLSGTWIYARGWENYYF